MQGEAESEGPSESECRPYIEKALKELETGEAVDPGAPGDEGSKEDIPTIEITTDDSDHEDGDGEDDADVEGKSSTESAEHEATPEVDYYKKKYFCKTIIQGLCCYRQMKPPMNKPMKQRALKMR